VIRACCWSPDRWRPFDTPELNALVDDLIDTMRAADGAGLAAPQIGVDLRVVVFGGSPSERYPDAPVVPFTVLINPVLAPLDDTMEEGWEGCLSVPGLRGVVSRHSNLRYTGSIRREWPSIVAYRAFHARVVQHECDHLDGILYPMRIHDFRRFGYTDVLFPRSGRQETERRPCVVTSQASSAAAGSGLLNRKPCTHSHPRLPRNASCASVSTPSAMTPRPRLCARLMVAAQIAASSGSLSMSFTNERSIFRRCTGISLR
jgi:peptide deformylase